MQTRKIAILILSLLVFISSASYSRSLEEIKKSGKIFVAFTSDDIKNINYPLAKEFARYLNVELVEVEIEWEEVFMHNGVIPEDLETNPEHIYTPDALKKADIICSTFTILDWRKRLFDFGETLFSAELLIISAQEELPDEYTDLDGKKITFQTSTTFEKHLKEINSKIGGGIELVTSNTSKEVQDRLKNGDVYGIVLDADEALNFIANNNHRYKIAFPVSTVTKTAWAVEKNNHLAQEVENFFETIASNGVLDDIFYNMFETRYTTFLDNLQRTQRYEKVVRDLDGILESKKLVIALRDRSFIYRPNGQKQFMHALAEEFADHLGVTPEIVITPYFGKYWETKEGTIVKDSSYTPEWFNYFDMACEVFSPLEWRKNKHELIPVYPSEYAIIARKETPIHNIEDLKGLKAVTGEQSVYEEILIENGIDNYYFEKVNNYLPDVNSGKADFTIMYNAFAEISSYPDLEVKLTMGSLNICWGIRKDQPQLKKELESFIKESSENGLIKVLKKSMQGNVLQSPDAYINSYYESFQTGQLPYVNYGADDGLPQEDVFSIFQDEKGYIWFGTNSGAVRYNGREMLLYNEQNGLNSNTVRDIKQDSSNAIYLATTNGIALLEYDTVKHSYFPGISVKKMLVDTENNKWLVGDDGVYILSKDDKEISVNSMFPELPRYIHNITENKNNGDIFLATSEGVFRISKGLKDIIRLNNEDSFSVYVDINDSIWYSTKSGLYISPLEKIGNTEQYLKNVFNLNERLSFPVDIISEIKSNKYGSVWLISDSRIYQVISTDQKPILYEQEIGIQNNKIHSFLADKEDNIWIGFSGGLQRLTNRRGLRNFFPNTINTYIYSIFQDKYNRIWVNSNNGIYYFDKVLKEFNPSIGIENNFFLSSQLPNGNILLVNSFGVYEIYSENLKMARYSQFPQLPTSMENVFVTSKGEIFILTGVQGSVYYLENFYSQPRQIKSKNTSNVYQLREYQGEIIGGSSTGIVRFNGNDFETLKETECKVWSLYAGDSVLWVGTDCGLGKVINKNFDQINWQVYEEGLVIKSILPAKNKNFLWIGSNKGFSYFNTITREWDFRIDTKDGLSGDEITTNGLFLDNKDLLWIGTYHGISNFNIRAKSFRTYAPVCYIESIEINGNRSEAASGSSFKHNENNFVFEISALSFTDERSVEYEYYLRGAENNYSSYHRGSEFKAYYNNLPSGSYEFIYKAKGKNNIWGYAESYKFTIKKAWYHRWVFRISLAMVLILAVYILYRARIRSIEAQKKKLEQLVKERTCELEEANTEIEAQRDLATEQRDKIASQQKEIVDSIQYAQRIQESMLPSAELLKKFMPEHFILFKPRDIVSGDFYWASQQNGKLYFTAADCTGHGVPGAFMSMLGMGFLNEIINKVEDIEPDEVLNQLRQYLIKTLHQQGTPGENKDGMDMVLCKYEADKKVLKVAAANNPLYHVRNGELNKIKGDPMPVAIHENMEPFTLHKIDIEQGDRIFLFSDGYADQFGGPKLKKFMSKRFRELIISSSSMDIHKQYNMLNSSFEEWKAETEQIDDVVVLGIKF